MERALDRLARWELINNVSRLRLLLAEACEYVEELDCCPPVLTDIPCEDARRVHEMLGRIDEELGN